MKKKNLLYIVCALAMGSLCGCDDFLNKDPQDMVPTILFLPVISLEMTIRMILSI